MRLVSFILSLLIAGSALAQDAVESPLQLAGKTCYTAFNTNAGFGNQASGAQKWVIQKSGDSLDIHVFRAWGHVAYGNPQAVTHWKDLGKVSQLQVAGNTLKFENSMRIRYDVLVAKDDVSGSMDASRTRGHSPTFTGKCQ